MSLEQLAYLGEIIASVAVVASLIYVARQLGQTTAMMRLNASHERVQRDFEIVTTIIESREMAERWAKGDSQLDSLDDIDRTRLMFFERRALVHWHDMFGSRSQKLLPDTDWNELRWVIQNFGRRQAVREAWKLFKGSFDKPFRDFIEEEFSVADGAVAERRT